MRKHASITRNAGGFVDFVLVIENSPNSEQYGQDRRENRDMVRDPIVGRGA
jgi:hypothetical protein